jgi:hypothetical protein
MLNSILANFYEADLRKLIAEIRSFKDDENLWKTVGSIKNSAGNLALHIIGGTNYLFGTQLAKTGYVRNRDLEFTKKNVPKEELLAGLEALIPLVTNVLNGLGDKGMEANYPIPFDDAERTNSYVLTRLLVHLGYHLGQVNYLRRTLE